MDDADSHGEDASLLIAITFLVSLYYFRNVRPRLLAKRKRSVRYSLIARMVEQKAFMWRLTGLSDKNCHSILRMDRATFKMFCHLLTTHGKLKDSQYVDVAEKVATFLFIIGHHVKNRGASFSFDRSGDTISIHFHEVLEAVLRCHDVLIATPVPVMADSQDPTWKHFSGCVGALDGTHIRMNIKVDDQPRYRKGHISVNMLGVCDLKMRFVYVLTGWESSVADGRVLRDALTRHDGLKFPQGNYYLVHCGYAHAPGSVAPFRTTRYHLKAWGHGCLIPQNPREYFNMKHSSARTYIERAFGLLKKRFAILRSPCFYPVDIQNNIILACCLIHNFCRCNMAKDLVEDDSSDEEWSDGDDEDEPEVTRPEYVENIHQTAAWTAMRDEMASQMYNN